MKILVLNAGSSSQKSVLFEVDPTAMPVRQPAPIWEAEIDGQNLTVSTLGGAHLHESLRPESGDPVVHLLQSLWTGRTRVLHAPADIDIVGHRVVHGGQDFREPVRITGEVKATIKGLSPLAPAHNPVALAGIRSVEELLGDVPQIAVFDTAFHRTLPDAAAIYPGPFEWVGEGIRRYGFHGISHGDCAQRAADILEKDLASLRLITCHLGNGCSLAAIKDGRSLNTTMGFTPLEGLMMGTRSGSIDPGLFLYLMRERGTSAAQLDQILNLESGLKGVSGLSGDMREIAQAVAGGNARARLAFDIYVHRLRAGIGAMLGSLGGLDALVFTGGVGEHSAPVRAAVCEGFAFLGMNISTQLNVGSPVDQDIAVAESKVRVLVIQAQEDWAIAKECAKFRLDQRHE